ncbi:MAG: YafY family protein [Pseudomonadota bacterium]
MRGGRLVRASDLAEKLEVSLRTIYRDIVDLQASGVPVEGEAGLGYVMREGFDLPPLMFNQDEIVALVAGARILRAFGGAAMAHGAEEALLKIEAVLPEEARDRAGAVQIHAFAPDMTDDLRSALDEIEAAVAARHRLAIDYSDADGERTTRVVQPLGLWFWGRVWTLVAWCELRQDFRMFRIDRIARREVCGTYRPMRERSLVAFYATQSRFDCDRVPEPRALSDASSE